MSAALHAIHGALSVSSTGLQLDESRLAPLKELLSTDASVASVVYDMVSQLQQVNAVAAAEGLLRFLMLASFGPAASPKRAAWQST